MADTNVSSLTEGAAWILGAALAGFILAFYLAWMNKPTA